jgi:hypothetical protein
MSAAPVFRVGLVDTAGIKCSNCGRPVLPKDIERIRGAICGICPGCHSDLLRIDLQRKNEEVSAA